MHTVRLLMNDGVGPTTSFDPSGPHPPIIAQTAYQNPNQSNSSQYSGKMYSLGWRKGYEEESKIGITGIAAKFAKDPDGYCKLQSHVPKQNNFIGNCPGLEPNFTEDPEGFTCHLSFTISNFSNKPHKDNDSSPFTFVMWIPIEQTTGNLVEEKFEVKGGEFVFPDDSC
ncbi:hypothetical protein VP01_5873g2, partial [Puccinia sorghi]